MQVDLEELCAGADRGGAGLRCSSSTSTASSAQRHLRPPGRRRAADPAGTTSCATRSARTEPPTGSEATSSACSSPATRGRFDAVDASGGGSADREWAGLRRRGLLGRGDDPGARPTSPTEALQLADVRMYAQKESRRLRARWRDPASIPPKVIGSGPQATHGGAGREITSFPRGRSATARQARASRSSSSTATWSTAASGTGSWTGSPIVAAASPRTGRSAPSRWR